MVILCLHGGPSQSLIIIQGCIGYAITNLIKSDSMKSLKLHFSSYAAGLIRSREFSLRHYCNIKVVPSYKKKVKKI